MRCGSDALYRDSRCQHRPARSRRPVSFSVTSMMSRAYCVIRVARQGLGVQHDLAAPGCGDGGHERDLDADLWTTPALQEESTNG